LNVQLAKVEHSLFCTMLSIQKVSPADAALITEISRSTFYDTYIDYNTAEDMQQFLDTYFYEENIRNELARAGNDCFVVYENDEPAGYVNLRESEAPKELAGFDVLEIARIYVVKNKIGSGVGKLLMEKSIEVAKQKNKQAIWLCVWQQNPRAIKFYERWGFEIFTNAKFILGKDIQDDWLMKKML
jgi:ribosomal protein S18 acetylase RimI-like enzyme